MTIGRPLEFDPDEALGAAVQVFWSKGYQAASLTDLLEAMTLSKSSLYQAFGGKRELFEQSVGRYVDELSAVMLARLDATDSGRRFIEETFFGVAHTAGQAAGGRGCLLANSASELGQRDPGLAAHVARGMERFAAIFCTAIERGQAAGEITNGISAPVLATYLLACMNGLRTMIKAGATCHAACEVCALMLRPLD